VTLSGCIHTRSAIDDVPLAASRSAVTASSIDRRRHASASPPSGLFGVDLA
jgi:hypothetical protein